MVFNEQNEQDEPVLDGSEDASDADKRQGIVDQVAADSQGLPIDDVIFRLTQRLTDSNVSTSDEQIRELAQSILS